MPYESIQPLRRKPSGTALGLLRGLLSLLIVLSLPPGAGVALLGLASALAWRLAVFLPRVLTRATPACGGGERRRQRTATPACGSA